MTPWSLDLQVGQSSRCGQSLDADVLGLTASLVRLAPETPGPTVLCALSLVVHKSRILPLSGSWPIVAVDRDHRLSDVRPSLLSPFKASLVLKLPAML
jgi:hypothetical protein